MKRKLYETNQCRLDIDLHMYQFHAGAEKLWGNGTRKLVLVEMAANHRMKLMFVNKLSSFRQFSSGIGSQKELTSA